MARGTWRLIPDTWWDSRGYYIFANDVTQESVCVEKGQLMVQWYVDFEVMKFPSQKPLVFHGASLAYDRDTAIARAAINMIALDHNYMVIRVLDARKANQ